MEAYEQNNSANACVERFKAKIEKANNHKRRIDKLSIIERDKEIFSNLSKRIDKSARPFVKGSLLHILFRAYEIQAELLPATRAKKEHGDFVELSIADSCKDLIYDDGNVDELYTKLVNDGFRKEGVSFVNIGYSDIGERLSFLRPEFVDVFVDYDKDTLAESQSDDNPNAGRWCAIRVGMTYGQALRDHPDMEGKIEKGDFLSANNLQSRNSEQGGNVALDKNDKVYMYFCYSIEDKEPEMVVFVGANAAVVDHAKGSKYEYKVRRSNGKDYAHLPLIDWHFTNIGEGICTNSMIGEMADIANSDQRILNLGIPGLEKVVNKIIAIFGADVDQLNGANRTIRDEIMLARERQVAGVNPIVPLPAGADIKTIEPASNVVSDFMNIKQIMADIASDRFNVDFSRNSADEVKATVFVGKTKAEIQAVQGLYKLNRHKFDRMAEYSVSLASRLWNTTDKRQISVVIDTETGDTVKRSIGELIVTLKSWGGRFVTDIDLKIPLSVADKSQAIVDLETQKTNIFYGKPWQSIAEIKDELVVLGERARLAGLDDLYSLSVLVDKARAILAGRNNMQAMGMKDAVKGEGLDALPDDVEEELSPNKELAVARAAGI